MSKSKVNYSSDTERSLYFLRSIQEPALTSQAKSLEVSILNVNAQSPTKLRGRAPLPPYLQIPDMAETMAQTVQPLDLDLDLAPTSSRTTYQLPLPYHMPFGYTSTPHGMGSPTSYYGPMVPYAPSVNTHVMQGSLQPECHWTEQRRGTPRKEVGRQDQRG
jgi:hypothetical protein